MREIIEWNEMVIVGFETMADLDKCIESINENEFLKAYIPITYRELCKTINVVPVNSVYDPSCGWTAKEISLMDIRNEHHKILPDAYGYYISLPKPHILTYDSVGKIDDSGDRMSYGEGRFDLISPFALARLAKWYELGAKKYADRNLEKGMPFSRYLDSAMRHLNKYLMGMRDEDHLAAAAWNIFAMIHHEERGEDWKLGLDDLPHYLNKTELGDAEKEYIKNDILTTEKVVEELKGRMVNPKRSSSWGYNPNNKLRPGCKCGDPYEII